MPKTGIDTASLQGAIIPALGVVPPSKSASHSSNRRAPPRSAASDDATESTQASTRIGAVSYYSSLGRNNEDPECHQPICGKSHLFSLCRESEPGGLRNINGASFAATSSNCDRSGRRV